MKCNAVPAVCQVFEESSARIVGPIDGWAEMLGRLPADLDLEATARACGALLRRRQVQRAADLLRLILAYAVCDAPLRLAASWYTMSELGRLSKTAVRQRLKHSVTWLGKLVAALLPLPSVDEAAWPAVRLRLLDATVISRPGSQGTDWRVHLSLDLGQDRLTGIELTDAHGAETLARFPVQEDEIRVGDGGYAHASGLGAVLEARGHIVVRVNWQNLPLEDSAGQRWDVATWLQGSTSSASEPQEQALWLPTPQGRFAVRLVACPLPPERAEEARRRARQRARKKKHVVDQRTLLAAGFVLVVTNLPAESWSAAQVLMLYRLRWQIELHIKCLKSVLNLDGLRVQDPEMAQAYLLAKLLAALLAQDLHQQVRLLHPDWWTDRQRPINRWHLTRLAWQVLTVAVIGPLTWTLVISHLIDVRRLVCDEPRKRSPQWLIAQRFLHGMPSC